MLYFRCTQRFGGSISAALLHNNFTVKGKEEFSDVIKKLLRDKYPGMSLIAWGEPSSNGIHPLMIMGTGELLH